MVPAWAPANAGKKEGAEGSHQRLGDRDRGPWSGSNVLSHVGIKWQHLIHGCRPKASCT